MFDEPFNTAASRPFWTLLETPRKARPAHLRGDVPLLASSAQLLEALKEARRSHERGESVDVSVALDGRVQMTDIERLLPQDDERSVDEYSARMEKTARAGQFTVILFGLHKFSPAVFDTVRSALVGFDQVTPLRHENHIDLDIFIGSYDRTPTGIHRDAATNFSYVVENEKSMLFWPYDNFAKDVELEGRGHEPLGTTEYEQHLATSTRVSAAAGEMIYWPRTDWHMSVDNERSLVLNIALYNNGQTADDLALSFAISKDADLGLGSDGIDVTMSVPNADGELEPQNWWNDVERRVLGVVEASRVADQLEGATLKRVSASHFLVAPAPRPSQYIDLDSVVGPDDGAVVPWAKRSDGTIVIGCAGRLLRVKDDAVARCALTAAHRGTECQVGELARDAGLGTEDQQRLSKLLTRMDEWHSLKVRNP